MEDLKNKPLPDIKDLQTAKLPDITSLSQNNLSESESSEPGMFESFLRGGEQGLTFGFGDEINAALESLSTGKSYEQAVQESREKFKQAEEANPWTTAGGNLAGALIPAGLVSKGVGAGARLLQGITGAAEAVPLISKVAAPASKLAGLVAEGAAGQGGIRAAAAAGAAEGGVFGGLTGAGSAESMEEIPERIKEEAKTGGILGGVGGAIFGTAKKAGDLLLDTDVGQDIARSWQLGTEKGINYLSAVQKKRFQEELADGVMKGLDPADIAWKAKEKAKYDALEYFKGNFDLDPDVVQQLEKELPSIMSDLSNPQNIKKLEGYLTGSQKQLNRIQGELDAHPLSDVLGLKIGQEAKPILLDDIRDFARASQIKEGSVRKVKILNKEAQERVDQLESIIADFVAAGKTGKEVSSDALRESVEAVAKEINSHPLMSDKKLIDLYAKFKSYSPKQQKEIIKYNADFGELVTSLEALKNRQGVFSQLEKLSTKSKSAEAVISESKKAVANIKKYLSEEVEKASDLSTNKFAQAEKTLMKSLKDHGIELSPEQLEALKNDNELLRNVQLRKKIEQDRLNVSKQLSSEQKNVTERINWNDYEKGSTQLDKDKGLYLGKRIQELKSKYNNFKGIPPEKAQELFKEIRALEGDLSPGQNKYIGDIAKDAPRTEQAFTKFKREVTKALSGDSKYVSPVDEFGNLLPSKKLPQPVDEFGEVASGTEFGKLAKEEKKIGDILELITGQRKSYASTAAEKSEMIKNALKAGEERFGIGERFNYQEALKIARELGDPKILEGLEKLKYLNELSKGYGAGSHRYINNKLSELFTKGVASAVSAETAGTRKFAGNVASKIPMPGDLFKPEVAKKLSEKSPTLGKILARISDKNTTEAKRRAYQNILMNNPIVRKTLTEHGGE